MGTKSKKWKSVVSFLAFLLGGALLLGSISPVVNRASNWQDLRDSYQDDYQDTWAFQRYMSGLLNRILDTAEFGGTGYEALVMDKSLLCEVWVDGVEVYSTDPAVPLFRGAPKGYTFYLTFDGSVDPPVTAFKDGVPVEIYKGSYKEGQSWEVPGFSNYVERSAHDARVQVYLAAADVPVRTPGSGTSRTTYTIYREMEHNRRTTLNMAIPLAAGLLLFALYIIWRKDKKRADQALARGTGRIWVEIKLLAAVGILVLAANGWNININIFSADITDFAGGTYRIPGGLLLYLYLVINSLRYNGFKAICRQSLCGTLSRLWRGAELKQPVGKRLQRRALTGFLVTLSFALGTMAWGWFCLLPWAWRSTDHQNLFLAVPIAILGLALLLVGIYVFRRGVSDARELDALLKQIEAVHAGDFSAQLALPEDADLRASCGQISDLRQSMEKALDERTRSERMKVELIANVSHDLKTPLTSIISYTELLSREEGLPDHVRDYVTILGQKSERLKKMVQEVFEVSKAASGELVVKRDKLDLCKLIRQTLADMAEPIERSGLQVREQLPEGEVFILADGDRLYRVFQNLIQNALQYSLSGSRVYITLERGEGKAAASVHNTSRYELSPGVDFTARFVRGDESRTDGGSGLGLAIARSFTEACGGRFQVEAVADLFTAKVEFPTVKDTAASNQETLCPKAPEG